MHYVVHKDAKHEWRWTLYATNGKKVATSGEGYEHKQHALDMVEAIKRARDAKVEVQE